MISKAKSLIKEVLSRFYYEHHNKDTFENDLEFEMKQIRLRAFSETKHRVLDALDHRIEGLTSLKEMRALRPSDTKQDFGFALNQAEDEGRLDELTTFRAYVKGMVIKIDEEQDVKNGA